MLGLWAVHTVEPTATPAGAAEIALAVEGIETIKSMRASWRAKDLTVIQTSTAMDFGFTFVALDQDGHRLRVFAPGVP